ncbi:hypothetical protein [Amycolatopsis suaedae]|uniref:DoxX family protein n=1 Tax=Amycolatopsis suaedae TaxID=2510978 RepID=A0A4Q7IYJ9_9PSEU|nr:hypothetical protein [Amycolatopsis suaedae]RZQ60050.1 hypothetical protein EWH70_30545 [Amycolatopsis suaedae]
MMVSRVMTVVRFLVAAVFLAYGGLKIAGGQYFYGDWVIDKKTVPGPGLVWAFYGYSPFYGVATGFFEFVPAVLLLFRRTATLGALALFAVSLNVTLMDFAFGFPVPATALVTTCTVLCGLLLWHDRQRLLAAFWRPVSPARSRKPRSRPASRG